MSDTPLNLTRAQLSEFLPNQRAIIAFELLLKQVNSLIPSDINSIYQILESNSIDSSNSAAMARQALSELKRIADSLELIATAPRKESNSITLE